MSLENLFVSVETGLYRFGRRICLDPAADIRAEADDVSAELRQERAALRDCRDNMAQMRQRVRANEARAALLASRVESFLYIRDGQSAFDHALELDLTRRRLAEDREQLRRALRAERDCLDGIHALEQRYDRLQDQLCRR